MSGKRSWFAAGVASALLPAACLHSFHWQECAPLPVPRAGYIAGVVGEKLVVAGGSYWHEGRKVWSDRTDSYDPATGAWDPGPRLPSPRSDAACTTLNGDLYAFGGGAEGSVESSVWRLRGGTWSVLPDVHLPAPRLYPTAAQVGGTIYIFGGLEGAGDYASATRTVWAWSPGGEWRKMAPIPPPARFSAAVAAANGRIVIAGGATACGTGVRNLDDAWIFDPRADRWSALPRLPVARRAWWGLTDGADVLLIGGYSSDFVSEIFCLNARTGEMRPAGSLPHALADAKFFQIGDRIVGTGGESGPKLRGPWTLEAMPRPATKKPS